MDQAEIEFLKAFSMIKEIVPESLEYRLHYNDDGDIYMCTMQQHPENTRYVVVNSEEYYNYFKYRVVSGVLKLIDNNPGLHIKLKLSDSGYATVKGHASLVLESGEVAEVEYWNTND